MRYTRSAKIDGDLHDALERGRSGKWSVQPCSSTKWPAPSFGRPRAGVSGRKWAEHKAVAVIR